MTAARFDAVLFDAGGVLVLPDPVAIGDSMEPFVGQLPHHRFHRAHHAGMRALEAPIVDHTGVSLEALDWGDYLRGYVRALGVGDAQRSTRRPHGSDASSAPTSGATGSRRASPPSGGCSPGACRPVSSRTPPARSRPPCGTAGSARSGSGAGVPVACVIDSAVVGVAKPDPAIFAPALAALGNPDPCACRLRR